MLKPRCNEWVHKGYFDSLLCWALFSIAQGKGHRVGRGGASNFLTGGLTLLKRRLKYGF